MLSWIRAALQHQRRAPSAVQPTLPVESSNRNLKQQGEVLLEAGDSIAARLLFEKALELNPQDVEAAIALGRALWHVGELDEARKRFELALRLDGDAIDAHYLLGLVLSQCGLHAPAAKHFSKVIELRPAGLEAYVLLAHEYTELGESEEVVQVAERGLKILPKFDSDKLQDPVLLNQAGLLARDAQRLEAALDFLNRALQLRPTFAQAFNNRGLVFNALGRFDLAVNDFDQALRIDESLLVVHPNRAYALRELSRHEEALAAYERMQQLPPDPDFLLNEGLTRLVLGDLAGGWPKYECRWESTRVAHPRDQVDIPMWLGRESLEGKTIFVYAEQGLGDTIQMSRYTKPLAERGATVLLGVQKPLLSLMQNLDGVSRLIGIGAGVPFPHCDYHCPLLSLPLAFNTSLDTIPHSAAYLHLRGPAFDARCETWRTRLTADQGLRIGVVWSGNSEHKNDLNRSIPLTQFVEILSTEARFVALQNAIRESDASSLREHPELQYVGAELRDFADTAALVQQLDLVVSVDTSVAHLAAAMGKPTWVLVPFNPDWRWLLHRNDSPWYDSVRLFRQSRRGEWGDVLAEVKQAMETFRPAA